MYVLIFTDTAGRLHIIPWSEVREIKEFDPECGHVYTRHGDIIANKPAMYLVDYCIKKIA